MSSQLTIKYFLVKFDYNNPYITVSMSGIEIIPTKCDCIWWHWSYKKGELGKIIVFDKDFTVECEYIENVSSKTNTDSKSVEYSYSSKKYLGYIDINGEKQNIEIIDDIFYFNNVAYLDKCYDHIEEINDFIYFLNIHHTGYANIEYKLRRKSTPIGSRIYPNPQISIINYTYILDDMEVENYLNAKNSYSLVLDGSNRGRIYGYNYIQDVMLEDCPENQYIFDYIKGFFSMFEDETSNIVRVEKFNKWLKDSKVKSANF